MKNKVIVVGAGLAGSEAAWQLASAGIPVELWEMKPEKHSPVHVYHGFGELVCSNSLRSGRLENAAGLIKEELRRFGSLIMEAADHTRVEAGGALAVDREGFSDYITAKIKNHPLIEVKYGEVTSIPEARPCIIAAGPLASDALSDDIAEKFGGEGLHFYDAVAPIVAFDSIDKETSFLQSRYDHGEGCYINCPLNEAEYKTFWKALTEAEEAEVHGFEDSKVFEGCMPVEVMARRGEDTLRFGPMKPVGLTDPRTGEEPYAVVQLRQDNAAGSLYNLVGFQTHLKYGEQKRVFSMIPALKNAEFVRYGVMHRNTYIHSPSILDGDYMVKADEGLYFAGQITGVEGYIESTASGFYAAKRLAAKLNGTEFHLNNRSAIGALAAYVSDHRLTKFQPMNVNYGIMAEYTREEAKADGIKRSNKPLRNVKIAERSLRYIDEILNREREENA
ncbi:MAG: methylenetetrahydrofolate--tRNA-(uracil(54)-C(5))-methyltransferase (FADH(2)-oxidizing) TrmFO [Clostridia bacterium]|nr:methylenetetrahydrofolate--tRNA-(uracil(54)-C(5))-methyltransferase (FADH(2)-oxidizing) TrmFO [Clostridia bacterium]